MPTVQRVCEYFGDRSGQSLGVARGKKKTLPTVWTRLERGETDINHFKGSGETYTQGCIDLTFNPRCDHWRLRPNRYYLKMVRVCPYGIMSAINYGPWLHPCFALDVLPHVTWLPPFSTVCVWIVTWRLTFYEANLGLKFTGSLDVPEGVRHGTGRFCFPSQRRQIHAQDCTAHPVHRQN
jgi:hypothetical protein